MLQLNTDFSLIDVRLCLEGTEMIIGVKLDVIPGAIPSYCWSLISWFPGFVLTGRLLQWGVLLLGYCDGSRFSWVIILWPGATLQMKQQNLLASSAGSFKKYVETQGFIYTADAPSAIVIPGGYALIFNNPRTQMSATVCVFRPLEARHASAKPRHGLRN